jgi:hypothetical protein
MVSGRDADATGIGADRIIIIVHFNVSTLL